MQPSSIAHTAAIRQGGPDALAVALRDTRTHTLATFAVYERALGANGCAVPYSPQLNPPLWELGHVGWFQSWWLARNPQRLRGVAADPDVARSPPNLPHADAWFDSSRVAHTERWRLPLPSVGVLRDDLARGLEASLSLLQGSEVSDDALYFHRLALFHEDMHHEAALYMAQHLDLRIEDWAPQLHEHKGELAIDTSWITLGSADQVGFAFDNELSKHDVELPAYRIDAAPVTWGRYLPFIEAGGYHHRPWWSDAGWQWLQQQRLQAPRYLRLEGTQWQRRTYGEWIDIDVRLPAMNLSCFEAQAFCAWAGRRLPTEAEWERAALYLGDAFAWGQVWEWTASPFVPYEGFVAHPYRDYSAPWFHSRVALRGGSFATHARMKHVRYRNFFTPERNDIFAGFRTCAR